MQFTSKLAMVFCWNFCITTATAMVSDSGRQQHIFSILALPFWNHDWTNAFAYSAVFPSLNLYFCQKWFSSFAAYCWQFVRLTDSSWLWLTVLYAHSLPFFCSFILAFRELSCHLCACHFAIMRDVQSWSREAVVGKIIHKLTYHSLDVYCCCFVRAMCCLKSLTIHSSFKLDKK